MAPQLDYVGLLGPPRIEEILKDKRDHSREIDEWTHCWLFTGSTNTDGYAQVWTKPTNSRQTGRRAQKAFSLHVLSAVAKTRANIPLGMHVSHLCDRRNCFNPDHLVVESPQYNNARKNCAGPIFCSKHQHLIVDTCTHTPRCLRHPRDDVRCCLTLMEEATAERWRASQHEARARASSTAPASSAYASSTAPQSSAYSSTGGSTSYSGATVVQQHAQQQQPAPERSSSIYSGASAVMGLGDTSQGALPSHGTLPPGAPGAPAGGGGRGQGRGTGNHPQGVEVGYLGGLFRKGRSSRPMWKRG